MIQSADDQDMSNGTQAGLREQTIIEAEKGPLGPNLMHEQVPEELESQEA